MTTSSPQKSPFLYVIDEDFIPPDRGDDRAGPESAVPAGDPDEAVRLFHHYRRLIAQEWELEPWRRTVFDAQPPNTVRRSPLRADWLRFAFDTGGNWLAVDMDPGPNGRPGQVIAVGVDYTQGPTYVADSVTTFLRRLVEALERGDYRHHDKSLWIDADLPNLSGRHTRYSDGGRWTSRRRPSPTSPR
ncbi:SMI1/KNR4 family protein [Streptomyces sp. NPDC059590]|uniref:SMI1/KNR4 family protein n=1 Tax=Streptomyces sp. NPDC059590 TaxID=3346877 RepID=UPI0036A61049